MKLYFFELVLPWEPELIGVKDGSSQSTVMQKGFKNKQHYQKFMEVFANPNRFDTDEAMTAEFELQCVKLKKDAILTDFLSFAPMSYLLISDKVYEILVKYNLGRCRFFKASVEDEKGSVIDGYRFFYQELLGWDIIDFPRCEFKKGNKFDGYKAVRVESKEIFFKDRFVKLEKMSLTHMPQGADMFKVKLPIGTLISETLQEELAAVNVSGMKFRKTEVEILDID